MAENSKIEWCDHTFNPWVGCTKISPACDYCYAEGWARRTGQAHLWSGDRRRTSGANWRQPLKWNRAAIGTGKRPKVFCASLADVFDNQVPERWRDDLWHVIDRTPHLDWLLLTKRPQNIHKMLPGMAIGAPEWGDGWPNVWLGTTVENQKEADRRIPHLLAAPATKRFLSCEPLLGSVDLRRIRASEDNEDGSWKFNALETGDYYIQDCGDGIWDSGDGPYRENRIDWVIVGGESGPHARPSHPDWEASLSKQCADAGVPYFRKQWGEWTSPHNVDVTSADTDVACACWVDDRWHFDRYNMWDANCDEDYEHPDVVRVGKKRAGASLDGSEWREMPE